LVKHIGEGLVDGLPIVVSFCGPYFVKIPIPRSFKCLFLVAAIVTTCKVGRWTRRLLSRAECVRFILTLVFYYSNDEYI
jgi:hypothetical protein